jgi:hypothetical protein
VVFHLREENHIALADETRAPGVCHQVDGLRGATCEDDGLGGRSADEAGDPFASLLELRGGAIAQLVQAAVDIGIVLLIKTRERVDDTPWLLAGGGIVEVDQGLAIDQLVQDRKLVPYVNAQWAQCLHTHAM